MHFNIWILQEKSQGAKLDELWTWQDLSLQRSCPKASFATLAGTVKVLKQLCVVKMRTQKSKDENNPTYPMCEPPSFNV